MLKGLSGSGSGAVAGQLPALASGASFPTTYGNIGYANQNGKASGSALVLATTVYQNLASFSLNAGVYLCWMNVNFVLAAATPTLLQAGVSQTSITLPAADGTATEYGVSPNAVAYHMTTLAVATGTYSFVAGPVILIPSGSTTYYGVVGSTFSAGGITCFGQMTALQIA